jgi:arsenite-transporting ATPase
MPAERRIMRAARPLLTRLTDLPVPEDNVFQAAQSVFEGVEKVKALLANPQVTSARLVVNPEKMVIDEARRTFTYLGLFGYGVDGVIVNRVLPDIVSDPYFDRWRSIQKGHLEAIDSGFADVPRLRLRLFDDEMVGIDRLRTMSEELYGAQDPVRDFAGHSPFRVTEKAGEVTMEMKVPFVDKGDLDVFRHGSELYLQVGPYRRSFVLPDTLRRRQVTRAKLEKGTLRVNFGPVPTRKKK